MQLDDFRLPDFLEQQLKEAGGSVEIEPDRLWLLFVVEAKDADTNSLARDLLADAGFAHDSGVSEDDRWMLYYVDKATRPGAVHWLQDLNCRCTGEIRPVSPAQQALIKQLGQPSLPHRVALQLGEMHGRDELSAGCIKDRGLIRSLLDRWHTPDPVALPSFLTLVNHHLLDLQVLHEQIDSEDIEALGDVMMHDVANDPLARIRHDAAGEIRKALGRVQVINSLEQEKNHATTNPYASYVNITCADDRVVMPVDGTMVRVLREHLAKAVRTTRKQLFRGEEFSEFNTLAPWVTDAVALPFRFIKQASLRKEIAPLDWLYMIERAIAPGATVAAAPAK